MHVKKFLENEPCRRLGKNTIWCSELGIILVPTGQTGKIHNWEEYSEESYLNSGE